MNKILLITIGALLLVSSSFMLSIFAEEIISSENVDHSMELTHQIEIWIWIAHWLTGVGNCSIGDCSH